MSRLASGGRDRYGAANPPVRTYFETVPKEIDTAEVAKTVLMAGSVIISAPIIILFFVAERFLTEGRTAGGVKG